MRYYTLVVNVMYIYKDICARSSENHSHLQRLIVLGIVICIITFLISNMDAYLLAGNVVISGILIVLVIVLFLNLAAVGRQPVQKIDLSFKVRECARVCANCKSTIVSCIVL